jgi:hypothetical protein
MKRRQITSLAVLFTVVFVLPPIFAQEGGWNPRGRYLFKGFAQRNRFAQRVRCLHNRTGGVAESHMLGRGFRS